MRGLLLAIIALIIVSADTAYDPQVLRHNASAAKFPAPLLWRAAQQGDGAAQSRLVDVASTQRSRYWLELLVAQDDPAAAWALYEMSDSEADQSDLMRLAALGNVPEAQLSYAMSKDDPVFREKWLKEAAGQGLLSAQAALADWYLLYDKPKKARPWLKLTADHDSQSAYKYGRLLWDVGEQKLGVSYLKKASENGIEIATELLSVIDNYSVTASLDSLQPVWPAACRQRIALFASSLSTIQRADRLYQRFNNDERLAGLPICVSKPVWLPIDRLSCDKDWQNSGRLGCDIRPLAPAIDALDASHVVVVSEQGKANINNGAMFLDIGDTYSVFVHELAHFSGFADEYPLSRSAARRVCQVATQPVNETPNLLFKGRLTYAPISLLQRWQSSADNEGVWPAKTCSAIGIQAFKPSGKITFMEHHDTGVIPPLYLSLWRQQLEDNTRQRPVSMNLFQSFHAHGQTAQAGIWLERYQSAVANTEPENRAMSQVSAAPLL